MATIVIPSTVTLYHNRSGIWIIILAIVTPPIFQIVTGEFTGIFASAKMNIALIQWKIINAMWYDDSFGKTIEIMVKSMKLLLGVQVTIPIKVTDILFFLGI